MTAQFVMDDDGNAGVLIVPAAGAGTPAAGVNGVITITTADTIFDLKELGFEAGMSASGLPIITPSVGIEGVGGTGFVGVNLFAGLDAKPWAEGHGELTYSFLFTLSDKAAEEVRETIMNALNEVFALLSDEDTQALKDYLGIDGVLP